MDSPNEPTPGSVRWHQQEWRLVMGAAAPEGCIIALAGLSYETAVLRHRLNRLESACDDLHAQVEHTHEVAHEAMSAVLAMGHRLRQPEMLFSWSRPTKAEKPN